MDIHRTAFIRASAKVLFLCIGLLLGTMLLSVPTNAHQQIPPTASPPVVRQNPESTPPTPPPSEPSSASAQPEEKKLEPVSILLIGQDHQEGVPGSRSDSIILCTFQPESNRLILTSFLRDLYLPIPGYGNNRINAAYAFGGASLLKQTLEQNFQLDIQGSIEVDFDQFAGIVDLLGGVEISLRQDEAKLISQETGTKLTEGIQTLNGTQALSYARIRRLDSDGDFSRTDRQRRLLETIWDSFQGSSTLTMIRLLRQILPMITTDMSASQLLNLALDCLPRLSGVHIENIRIPGQGQYTDKRIDGMAVLVPDMAALKETLQQLQESPSNLPK